MHDSQPFSKDQLDALKGRLSGDPLVSHALDMLNETDAALDRVPTDEELETAAVILEDAARLLVNELDRRKLARFA